MAFYHRVNFYLIRKILVVTFFLVTLSFCYLTYSRLVTSIPFRPSEISWYFHTTAFDNFFIKRDFATTEWGDSAAYDHPPVSKYIFGAWLYSRNTAYRTQVDTLIQKYGRWDILIKGSSKINYSDFRSTLINLRSLNLFLTLALLAIIAIFSQFILRNWLLSISAAILLAYNPIFYGSVLEAMPDVHYLLWLFGGSVVWAGLSRSPKHAHIILFSLLCGLAVSTKLTGLILLISFWMAQAVDVVLFPKQWAAGLTKMVAVTLLTMTVWLAINPTIWQAPISNSFTYFETRQLSTRSLKSSFPELSLANPSKKLQTITCRLLSGFCPEGSVKTSLAKSFILDFGLLTLGTIYVVRVAWSKKQRPTHFILISILTGSVLNIAFLEIDTYRYYLPLLIYVYVIQIAGFGYALILLKQYIHPLSRALPLKSWRANIPNCDS